MRREIAAGLIGFAIGLGIASVGMGISGGLRVDAEGTSFTALEMFLIWGGLGTAVVVGIVGLLLAARVATRR